MPTVGSSERRAVGPGGAPPWVVRPWDERLNFFQLLGVSEDASREQISAVLAFHLQNAEMRVELLPPGVEHAAGFLLATDEQRALYRQLLQHCHTGQPFRVDPELHRGMLNLAEFARLNCWQDPERPNDFHFRQIGQAPPAFVAKAMEEEEARRQAAARLTEEERQKQRYEQQAFKRLFLRFAYAFGAIILVGVAGVWLFDGVFSRGVQVAGVLDEREAKHLEVEEREALAVATDATSQLEAALGLIRNSVQRDLGVSLEMTGTLPSDFEAVIAKEPTAADAWRNLKSASRDHSELERRQFTLKAITNRVGEKNFLKADVEMLREIKTWAVSALTNATSQQKNVDHIRALLEVERFNRAGQSNKEP